MPLTHGIWITTSAIALVAALTAAGLYIRMQSSAKTEIIAAATVDPPCDLQQGPCVARFPSGEEIAVSIAPLPIQGLKPLQITVQTQNFTAREVAVDFQGIGMNMGYNRPRLNRESGARFTGNGMLSVCVLERMQWEATVLVTTEKGVMAAPFQFDTLRP
ncbi:MAG: hypothetical protein KDI63_09155 [Gammaproteobacteria bacterium]|nr:hypothetical protein [Gammaproteobacteria bacterium]